MEALKGVKVSDPAFKIYIPSEHGMKRRNLYFVSEIGDGISTVSAPCPKFFVSLKPPLLNR